MAKTKLVLIRYARRGTVAHQGDALQLDVYVGPWKLGTAREWPHTFRFLGTDPQFDPISRDYPDRAAFEYALGQSDHV